MLEIRCDGQPCALQCALKAADIGHLALPGELHRTWVHRLQDEWHAQGDLERKAGMPISALMDREKSGNITSSQVGSPYHAGTPHPKACLLCCAGSSWQHASFPMHVSSPPLPRPESWSTKAGTPNNRILVMHSVQNEFAF